MSDQNTDLAARLALLADEIPTFEGGKRALDRGAPLQSLLDLIDQTVIQTSLEVQNDAGSLTLEVASRRLIAIPGVADALSADTPDALAAATDALRQFADQTKEILTVTEQPATVGGFDPAQSVSVSSLARAAGHVQIDPSAPLIARFRAHLGDGLATARVLWNGGEMETLGDAGQDYDGYLTQLVNLKGQDPAPQLTVLDLGADKDGLAGVVTDAGSVFAFIFNGKEADALLRAFRASCPD